MWGRAGHRTIDVSKAPNPSVQEGFIAQFLQVRRNPRTFFQYNQKEYKQYLLFYMQAYRLSSSSVTQTKTPDIFSSQHSILRQIKPHTPQKLTANIRIKQLRPKLRFIHSPTDINAITLPEPT